MTVLWYGGYVIGKLLSADRIAENPFALHGPGTLLFSLLVVGGANLAATKSHFGKLHVGLCESHFRISH